MRLTCSFRMPLRFARHSAGGMALTIVAIGCGVALVCAIDLANRAVLRAFVEIVDTMAGRAALEVAAGEGGLFPEDVAARVGSVPGVELALPVVKAMAFTLDGSGESLTVHGVDLTDKAAEGVYGAKLELDDPLVLLSHADSVVLSRAFAASRSLASNDRIDLMTPAGRRSFTIRGLLEPAGVARAYGGNVALMDLYGAEALFTRAGFINGVDVVVKRDAEVTRVAEAIARVLPEGLRVETPVQRQADLHRVMQSLRVALDAMGLFGLVAAFLIAFNRLSTVFEARSWQLGVLRAVGVRRRIVWRELLKESAVLGTAGVVFGIPLGIGLGRLLLPVIATTATLAYNLVAPRAELAVHPSSLALATALGLGSPVLAAALPAWRASRVALAATIRSRGVEQPGGSKASMWLVRAATAVAIGMAMAAQSSTRSATAGLLATGLIAVGTALAARPPLQLIGCVLPAVFRRLAGPSGQLAAANLVHNLRRTALTVGTVGVGLGCVVWFWTMADSFQSSLVTTLTAALRADLVVTSTHVASGYVEAPMSEDLLARLARVPGVRTLVASRVIDWPHSGRSIAIEAIDPTYFTHPELGQWPLFGERIADVWERVARGEAVIVSANFALNFKARVGDPIVLHTPTGPLQLSIGGITAAFESPSGTIQMSREVYSARWRDRQVNRVGLKTAPGETASAVREAIAHDLGRTYDLRILSPGELIEYYATQVRRAFAPLHVLAATVMMVTLLGMADTLVAGILERTRELGMMRALGVRRGYLARMVFLEALLLGGSGFALALTAGLALAVLWVKGTLPYLLGWVLALHIPYRELPMLAAITVTVSLAAAVLPACRAARLQPEVAIRQE